MCVFHFDVHIQYIKDECSHGAHWVAESSFKALASSILARGILEPEVTIFGQGHGLLGDLTAQEFILGVY